MGHCDERECRSAANDPHCGTDCYCQFQPIHRPPFPLGWRGHRPRSLACAFEAKTQDAVRAITRFRSKALRYRPGRAPTGQREAPPDDRLSARAFVRRADLSHARRRNRRRARRAPARRGPARLPARREPSPSDSGGSTPAGPQAMLRALPADRRRSIGCARRLRKHRGAVCLRSAGRGRNKPGGANGTK